jgi:ABC-type Fe3+-siderophore transport system permease subunit
MKMRDLVSSLIWMVLGAFFVVGALQQGLIRKGVPGPGFLPFISGLALILVSLFVLIPALRRTETDEKILFFPEQDSFKKLSMGILALFSFGFAMLHVGYILTTFVFMLFMARIMRSRSWWTAALVALLTSALTYILFEVLLAVHLPKGQFGY